MFETVFHRSFGWYLNQGRDGKIGRQINFLVALSGELTRQLTHL